MRRRLGAPLKPLAAAICVAAILAVVLNWLAVPVRARSVTTPDSKGTDFWLTFMQNFDGDQLPLALTLFVTGDAETTVTVTVPGLPAQDFTVHAGALTAIDIAASAQLTTNDTIESKGIHLTATNEVTVYGLNQRPFSTDAYLALPTDILGTDYIVLGYRNRSENENSTANQTEFAIVGTENSTDVTIVPSVDTPTTTPGVTHPAGVPYVIRLDRGQTYQLQTAASGADLSGSTINTTGKAVAVFGGHSCANVPNGIEACDHVVEQLPPTSTWGRNFIAMPLARREHGDVFRFLARKDHTRISLNGVFFAELQRGQFIDRPLDGTFDLAGPAGTPLQVTSTEAILVAQYATGADPDGVADPFMLLVPPNEQLQASYTVTTPSTVFTAPDANFINVVIPSTAVDSLRVDGLGVAASFHPISGSPAIFGVEFSGAQLQVSAGSHTLSASLEFGITVYGYAENDSYGYPGGMALAPIVDAVDDAGSSVNGFTGGQTFQNVRTNDTLNGAIVSPSQVTLSLVSRTSTALTLNTSSGAVTVAAQTAAGTYQLVYKLCAVQSATNCDTATVTVPVTPAPIVANDDTGASVDGTLGGTSVTDVLANDRLNGAAIAANAVTVSQVSTTNAGVTLNTSTGKVSVAPSTPASGATPYSLVYQICEVLNPTNCDTATVTVPVTAVPIDAVNDTAGPVVGAVEHRPVVTNVLGNDTLNGVTATLSTVDLTLFAEDPAKKLKLNSDGSVDLAVAAAGTYALTYKICEKGNATNCDTATVTVTVSAAPIDAVNDDGGSVVGDIGHSNLIADVLANDTLNGVAADHNDVTLTTTVPDPNGKLTLNGNRSVDLAVAAAGTYTLTYKICENLNPTNCDTAVVSVIVTAPVIDAVDDAGSSVNGTAGGTSLTNVLANDTLNGVAVTPSAVTLTFVSSTNAGVTLSGSDVVVAPGTPASGATSYSLVYRICEVLNPANCDTATVTVPVTVPVIALVIDAVNDTGTSVNGTTGGTSFANVLANDTLNGVAVVPAEIVLSFVSSTQAGVTLSGTNVVVLPGTPASGATPYALVYRICEAASPANCDTATVTVPVTVPAPPPPPGGCVREADYWLSHPDEWPVVSLTLGSVVYSKAQLLRILDYSGRSDVRVKSGLAILASDLIVAKLNQAAGAAVPPSVIAAMAAADALIGRNVLPPVGQCSVSPIAANALDCLLDAYNKGETRGGPPSCRDCSSGHDDKSGRDDDKSGKDGKDGKDDNGKGGNDGKDDKGRGDGKDGRDGRDGDDDRSSDSCGFGKGSGGHHDGDSCVEGHHGHSVGDRCEGADGVHHDGDGCDTRSAAHNFSIKSIKKGNGGE